MKRLALLLLLALPSAARARALPAEFWKGSRSAGWDAARCLSDEACFAQVADDFSGVVDMRLQEVEASTTDRFFPGAVARALWNLDDHGNFLLVRCGAERIPCDGPRDELERRVIYSSLLQALPFHGRSPEYYDAETWALTAKGEAAVRTAAAIRPGLLRALADKLFAKRAKRAVVRAN